MPIVFARVDDRLIHGQIVQAWLPELSIDEVVIPCPPEREHSFHPNLLRLSLPFEYQLTLLPPHRCVPYMLQSEKRLMLLLACLPDLKPLLEDGLPIKSLNIGGMHFKENAHKLDDHVFLDEEDKKILKIVQDLGIEIETRAVPASGSLSVKEILQ